MTEISADQVATTREEKKAAIKHMLAGSEKAVTRALLAIYAFQTASEQATESTNEDNGVGFTGADAEFLTSLAKSVIKWGSLTAGQMKYARPKMMKYHRQLADIAEANGRVLRKVQTVVPTPVKVDEDALVQI